ncbi:FAD binding domain protein [Talaromyces proteolyticus]|uniref:FAD binding domain protein n=1 Tax=Talaromyces proteolyticus TaxID=1131652 RepID=A0AAD4PTV4_9EURO|nr:FAD binding domain protein [Talaromyces proteolyticus]KAH8691430.1 FAD binding domain protein [Talaromyces proteolyticus]
MAVQNHEKTADNLGGYSKLFQLHLVIVGAGLAGLAAAISTRLEGHQVTILEKVPELQEIGAGLQLTPNATRLFRRWGIFDQLESCAATPSALFVRRYDGTQLLAKDEGFQDKIIERYGSPFWDVHRADIQAALIGRAKSLGVDIRLSAEVEDIDFKKAEVRMRNGQTVVGDIILAADGLWSHCRSLFLKQDLQPKPTGDLAYRIVLNIEDVGDDSELQEWLLKPTVNFWIGPGSHVVGYSLRRGQIYNLVLLCPDDLPQDVSRAPGNLEELRKLFESWDPILSKFLACVNSVDKWKLMHLTELDRWKNDEGTFLMAGDSCHPMLPYLAQGANSSIEDGAVLGRLLKYVTSRDDLPQILDLYQELRKRRGEAVVREASKQRDDFHLPDGPLQQHRDTIFLSCLAKEPTANFPSRWTCPTVQPWLYGYDAVAEVDKVMAQKGFEV